MLKQSGLTLTKPFFDWYQSSIFAEVSQVLDLLRPLGGDEGFRDEKPKLKGYAWARKCGGPGGSVLVHYGGRNGDEHGPNVAGTGPMGQVVSDVIRGAGLKHGVGRADVAIDFLGDFEACRGIFIERCNRAGMASSDAGSCPESVRQLGRTVYGGSRSSSFKPTLYEKGLQLGDGYPANYLRLENRVTPSKAAEKAQLAVLTPEQIIGLRPVTRDLAESIAGLAVAPYKLARYPKEKGPYFWLLTQYGGLLRSMHEDHGSWAALGAQIGADLAEMVGRHE